MQNYFNSKIFPIYGILPMKWEDLTNQGNYFGPKGVSIRNAHQGNVYGT